MARKTKRWTVYTAREMTTATDALRALIASDGITDTLSDQPPLSYKAIMKQVVECRALLSKIEEEARRELLRSATWHREILEGIEALGVIETPTMRAVA